MRRFAKQIARRRLCRDAPPWVMRDWCLERVLDDGGDMFEGLKIGDVIAVDTISFPYVGRVDGFGDSWVRLTGAVKILWDGRHGQFARGKVPGSAEVEATYSPYTISADAIIAWGAYPYPIPKEQ